MKNQSLVFAALAIAILLLENSSQSRADLVLNTVGVAVTEDFNDFRGDGFAPTPSSGQLDSDTYRVTGLSDGAGTFGGTHDTGDFARGDSDGGVGTGGIYAFEVAPGDFAAGVQPTETDMSPGSVTIRISNNTGETLNFLDVRADAYFLNNADRSSTWLFEAALVDSDPFYVPFFSLASEAAGDSPATWQRQSVGDLVSLSPLSIPDGTQFFVRVTGDDLAGSGARDEFALDNLSITGLVAVPEPGATILALGALAGLGTVRRRKG